MSDGGRQRRRRRSGRFLIDALAMPGTRLQRLVMAIVLAPRVGAGRRGRRRGVELLRRR